MIRSLRLILGRNGTVIFSFDAAPLAVLKSGAFASHPRMLFRNKAVACVLALTAGAARLGVNVAIYAMTH